MMKGSGLYQGHTFTVLLNTETNLTAILFSQDWHVRSEYTHEVIDKALRIWQYLFPQHKIQTLNYLWVGNGLVKGISILGEKD